jgi:hypothetical protein
MSGCVGGVGWKDEAGGIGHQEAVGFKPKAPTRRDEAEAVVRRLGQATAFDVAQALGRHFVHVAPRLSELFRMGRLRKAEGKGVSAFGRNATLYRVSTPAELAEFLAAKSGKAAPHG